MKLRLLLSLSLWLALPAAFAETADDFFHDGAVNYLSNNIPMALEVVTNGRALYPDDLKLKKLEELLKQQQQQKEQQQKQNEKKDPQSQKQDKKDQPPKENQSPSEKKPEEQKPQPAKSAGDQKKPDEKQTGEPSAPVQAHAMTPQEAKQLLDAQKGDEQVLQFKPPGEPKRSGRVFKDW